MLHYHSATEPFAEPQDEYSFSMKCDGVSVDYKTVDYGAMDLVRHCYYFFLACGFASSSICEAFRDIADEFLPEKAE